MSSIAAAQFAVSQRTIADLRTLAEASPAEAQQYLESVAARLPAGHAAVVRGLLDATGSLVDRIQTSAAKLGQVFAPAPGEWGALQAARASTLGWSAEAQPPTVLTGRVKLQDGAFVLESPGRRPLKLAEGGADDSVNGMPSQWMFGLIEDMELNVAGTLGADGQTFNVSGYAPAKPGYESFTMARVWLENGDMYLRSPSGERIELTNPELREKLAGLHKLALILPGGTKELAGGKKAYDGNPASYFGLARFRDLNTEAGADGTITAHIDMAHNAMQNAPAKLPAELKGRVNHQWRVWLEGALIAGEGGKAAGFAASYVGRNTDTVDINGWNSIPLLPKVPDAGALDAARELAAP